jgi:RNA polymerase sigma-70 factor (ECF subfamily)
MQKLSSESKAMDIVQETMTLVWRKAHLFNQDKGAAKTWVYTLMRNQIFDHLRKLQSNKESKLSEDIWPIEQVIADEQFRFFDHIESKKLQTCIAVLPAEQRQIIEGLYFQELSQEQLAKQMDLPLGTVKSRLRLAIARLKQQLGAYHD